MGIIAENFVDKLIFANTRRIITKTLTKICFDHLISPSVNLKKDGFFLKKAKKSLAYRVFRIIISKTQYTTRFNSKKCLA